MSQHLNSMLGEAGDCPMIGDNDDLHILPMLGSEQHIRSVANRSRFLIKLPFEDRQICACSFGLRLSPFCGTMYKQLHVWWHQPVTQFQLRALIDRWVGIRAVGSSWACRCAFVWAYRGPSRFGWTLEATAMPILIGGHGRKYSCSQYS